MSYPDISLVTIIHYHYVARIWNTAMRHKCSNRKYASTSCWWNTRTFLCEWKILIKITFENLDRNKKIYDMKDKRIIDLPDAGCVISNALTSKAPITWLTSFSVNPRSFNFHVSNKYLTMLFWDTSQWASFGLSWEKNDQSKWY